MTGYFYSGLYIVGLIVLLVRAQGPAYISGAFTDVVSEVCGRRPEGTGLTTVAATGAEVADPATRTLPATRGLAGVAVPGTGSVTHHPVYIHALFSSSREAPGAIADAGAAGDMVATATANFAARTGGVSPDVAEFSRQMAPYFPVRRAICNPNDPYRTADGSCNNLNNPLWGASITPQPRFIAPEYGDPFNTGSTPRIRSRITGNLLPNPRDITNAVHNAGMSPPRNRIYNVALTHFGQFIDHDVISTPILKDNWTFVAIGSALGVVAAILLVIGLIYFKNKNSKEQIFVKFDNEKDTTSRDHEIT